MQIPRHRIQRTMAQQVKRVLAVLVLVLMVYIMGSILLLGRERCRNCIPVSLIIVFRESAAVSSPL